MSEASNKPQKTACYIAQKTSGGCFGGDDELVYYMEINQKRTFIKERNHL